MSKVVSAVNAMIVRSDKIKPVIMGSDGEIFFKYGGKHNWSIKPVEEEIYLWYYPGEERLESIVRIEDWGAVPMVTYRASEVGGREAKDSFRELHTLLKEKVYGVDEVLKDIIQDADDLP